MKVKEFRTLLNESGNPYLVEKRTFKIDGRTVFDTPNKIADFVMDSLEI